MVFVGLCLLSIMKVLLDWRVRISVESIEGRWVSNSY